MAHGRQSPETVSKKKTIFFANGEVFFLTYFLIGASGGLRFQFAVRLALKRDLRL